MTEPAALGIDLGTTFSVVSQIDAHGQPVVLPNSDGLPTTPSVVLFDGNRAVVGSVAERMLATEPDSVVQLVKRHMGSQWVFDYGGVSFRPEHVSSLILRKLCADARALAGPVEQVAVTVPAYFNDSMRLATRRAGELAGLDVLGLLSEPTAAALAYGYQHRPSGTTGVVVDLGGGTFDVTVMDYDGADLSVRATGGDAYLGGANFDKAIFDIFVEQFRDVHALDINDPEALSLDEFTRASRDWLSRANGAKHDLTVRDRATVSLQVAGLTHRAVVSRAEFLDRTRVLLDEMTEKMLDVVASAGVSPKDVGVVLAVGGSTRVPAVRERIRDIFGVEPESSVRPDEAVALGAALFASQQQLERGGALSVDSPARPYLEDLNIHDVAAHSLGISAFEAVVGEGTRPVMTVVLPRNTPLPNEGTKTFYTLRDNETNIIVPVLEGEHSDPQLCRRVGVVSIDGLPAGRPARQRVDVTMRLDRDGILDVSAVDAASGHAARTRVVHADVGHADTQAADLAVRSMIVE